MASLLKNALVGHSYCRRLNKDIRDGNQVQLKRNINLSQCQVKFRWSGGWEVLDRDTFNFMIAPFLQDFKPDVVVMQVGGYDVGNKDETVQSVSIANNLDDF